MYSPRQVIWDADKKKPYQLGGNVWDIDDYPEVNTNFQWTELGEEEMVKRGRHDRWRIALPKSVDDALELLEAGLIIPAPVEDDRAAKIKALLDFEPSEDDLNYAYWKHNPWYPEQAAEWLTNKYEGDQK